MDAKTKRGLMVSSKWGQAIVIVFLFGFFVLGLLAYRTYTSEPPIPAKVVDPSGQVLFTRADIIRGQETFLRNGLMEYGSIFGHGAYLGPDYTADYLHRAALIVREQYGGAASDARGLKPFGISRPTVTTPRPARWNTRPHKPWLSRNFRLTTRTFSRSPARGSACVPRPSLIPNKFMI